MYDFRFNLNAAYCFYYGVAVAEQKGSYIRFCVENTNDDILKEKLKVAFSDYLKNVLVKKDCPEIYRRLVKIEFEKCERSQIREYVAEMCKLDSFDDYDSSIELLFDDLIESAKNSKVSKIHIENNSVNFRFGDGLEQVRCLSEVEYQGLLNKLRLFAGTLYVKTPSCTGSFVYGSTNPVFINVLFIKSLKKADVFCQTESAVLQLLDSSRIPLSIFELGFNEVQVKKIKKIENIRQGLVLICGKPDSGKTTTACSLLMEMVRDRKSKLKILNLENLPSYYIPGVTNCFSKNLRTTERILTDSDCDVVFWGDIKNYKNAQLALNTCLSGKLVIGILNCDSGGDAISLLESMGINTKSLSMILKYVISQEMINLNGKRILLGDVECFYERFREKIELLQEQKKYEDCFEHCINSREYLSKVLRPEAMKVLPYITANQKKDNKIWRTKSVKKREKTEQRKAE